jgi:hypothetical protein
MSLLAPLFLAGLAAIALPIWLHRLSSENPNRKPFSSLMFLEAGEPRRVLAKNVQYLLLLALRIALLVLLALAFAQPAWWREPPPAGADGAELHVLVLDGSASMAAGDRWERATAAALDRLGSLESGDRGQLVLAGRTTELRTGVTADLAELRRSIAAASPGAFPLDYGRLTRALDGVIANAELPVVVDFFTDAQASGLPARFAELAPRAPAEIRIHAVAGTDDGNWAIDSLAGSALSGELVVNVKSYAEVPATKTLALSLNGRPIDERVVTVEPGGRAEVTFPAPGLAEGSNRVVATLSPGDTLAADDARYVALQRAEPRPVLLISGDIQGGRDTLFIRSAIDALTRLSLAPEVTAAGAVGDRALADYRFVIVADAGALPQAAVTALGDYVASGGAALIALGPRSTGLTAVPVTGQPFDTTAVTPRPGSGNYASVGDVDASHPALRGAAALRTAKFFRYAPIQPADADDVLVGLDSGAPLLLERRVGDGRVLLFTSSLDRQWNDLPLQPVFVPLIAGLANHLLGGAGFSVEVDLGSTVALRAVGLQGGRVFDPSGEPAVGLGQGTGDVLLDQIGFYEFVGGGRTEYVAVNFDARESDLAPLDAATIDRWQALGRRRGEAATAPVASVEGSEVAMPLGPWILALLVLAALVESWVGNWHLRVRRGIAA